MARDIDLENLSEDDVAYIEQRHWMIQELEFQGYDWEELKRDAGVGGEVDYNDLKVAELDEEIAKRNEGRAEEDLIPDDGNKADKVAALEADDAASSDDE